MANKNGNPEWTKGHKHAGPGRPKSPDHIKKAIKLTREQAKQLFLELMHKTEDEVKSVVKDPKTTVLQKAVAKIALEAIKSADTKRVDFMLDRTIGKVKEEVEVKLPTPYVVENIETGKAHLLGAKDDSIDAEVINAD